MLETSVICAPDFATRAEAIAFYEGVQAAFDHAKRAARALATDPAWLPTRIPFAIAALNEYTIPPAVPIADLPEPCEKTKVAIAVARRSVDGRRKRVRMKGEVNKDMASIIGPAHADAQGNRAQFLAAFGTCSDEFAELQFRQLVEVCKENGALSQGDINGLLAIVDGVRPDNELEAALAVQITASHALSMRMLRKAGSTERLDFMDRYMNAATKLQRTMVAQIEALAKLRRGGEQNVIVKHVHIHDGGQAIVGNVKAEGRRSGIGNSGQTRARAFSDTEMRREDEVREALPITSGLR